MKNKGFTIIELLIVIAIITIIAVIAIPAIEKANKEKSGKERVEVPKPAVTTADCTVEYMDGKVGTFNANIVEESLSGNLVIREDNGNVTLVSHANFRTITFDPEKVNFARNNEVSVLEKPVT